MLLRTDGSESRPYLGQTAGAKKDGSESRPYLATDQLFTQAT